MKPIFTCVVAGLQYLIHPQKLVLYPALLLNDLCRILTRQKGSIQETINPDAIIPITLLTTDEVFGDLESLLHLLDEYDDVFTAEFGSVLVEKPGKGNGSTPVSLQGQSARQVYHLDDIAGLSDDFSELPSGPYFLHGPNLYQAWRLYDDDLEAFTFGVIPDDVNDPNGFQVLSSLSSKGDSKSIAVPSRLYHPRPSLRKPLSGVRISIGDLFSLNGTGTTLSSRAWMTLYNFASTTTSEYARNLIDLGAIIVGKTKTPQFGVGAEWVDTQPPWSARGDGYQILSGSSVGAAASLIGYNWLQQSIGGDDYGLTAEGGLYSIALSPGGISLNGVMETSNYTNGRLFSRSLKDLLHMTTTTLGISSPKSMIPKRIIYPVDLHPVRNSSQKIVMDGLISTLEKFVGAKVEEINLGETWAENRPAEAHGEAMQTYMKDVSTCSTKMETVLTAKAPSRSWCYDYYHAFNDFRDEFSGKFHKKPFVEATPQFLWNLGEKVVADEYREHVYRIGVYRKWFHEHIMALNSTPKAEAIMILPCGTSDIRHRDESSAPPTTSEGVTPEYLAPILGAPHLAVPFAQQAYQSRISGRTEYQPICVSLMGARGSESGMIQLVKQAFEKAQWRTQVKTGRSMFPPEKDFEAADNGNQLPML
ncbi:hypothetical protein AK830_g5768 [Neonectria ditissima]|uniref:Amidase domain-containing protein n=1 Tax=Neonectria ditissima TaxID=78410 RepID=A0A0P7B443_9HYPO|nr:hypothetical protein AK830_g5768 [Neonectria ditissima]